MDMPGPPKLGYPDPPVDAAPAESAKPGGAPQDPHSLHAQAATPGCTEGAAVDWNRVILFREAIASGTYDLRPYRIATSLMRFESSLDLCVRSRSTGQPWEDRGDFASAEDLLQRIYLLLCEEFDHLGRDPQDPA